MPRKTPFGAARLRRILGVGPNVQWVERGKPDNDTTMKQTRMLSWMLVAATCLATAGQDAHVLRRELKEGATDVYQVDSKVDQTVQLSQLGMGDQKMVITSGMKMALSTGKVDPDKHTADLKMVSSDFKFDMEGLAGMAGAPTPEMPKEVTVTGTIDHQNRISGMKAVGPGAGLMGASTSASSGTMFVSFPEHAVKVGDTWDVVIPKNPAMGNAETVLKATLKGEAMDGDVPVWLISMQGTLILDMDMAEMMKDDPQAQGALAMGNMKVSGKIDLQADAQTEKGSGRTRKMVVRMKGKQKMDMADMGLTLEMEMAGTTSMSLVDAPR